MNPGIISLLHDEDFDVEELFALLPQQVRSHSICTADFTAQIVEWSQEAEGFEEYNLNEVRKAAKYHDIGMALLPNRILSKRTELTAAEFKVIEKHTLYGSKFLEDYRLKKAAGAEERQFWQLAAEMSLSHHERWDGKGYPNRGKTNAVILPVRALSIAVTFDSMVRGAPYRMPLPPEFALFEIVQNGGRQFDPVLTELIKKNCDCILSQTGS